MGQIIQGLVPEVVWAPDEAAKAVSERLPRYRDQGDTYGSDGTAVFLVDDFFDSRELAKAFGSTEGDLVLSIATEQEPRTQGIDILVRQIREQMPREPAVLIGIGGGSTLDTTKAVSNLLGNPGEAADFQGWDLLRSRGTAKIGVPTLSGTGAEASRTCVLTNHRSGVKLGMNSPFSIFDMVVIDAALSESVPPNQYFFTGMDTYMHCIESLSGSFRNPLADSFSMQALALTREVFSHASPQSFENRSKLMVASFLGGAAIAGSYVGLIHPMSAGLSVVFGVHHGVANCMVMRGMKSYYPSEYLEFWTMAEDLSVEIPLLGEELKTSANLGLLAESTLVHERPLENALGPDYRTKLQTPVLEQLFSQL